MVVSDLAVRSAIGSDGRARQPAVTGRNPGVAVAGGGVAGGRGGMAGLVIVALDDSPDFLAADADIREGAVIERHQFAKGALPLPPVRDRVARRNKEIDERHCSDSFTRMVHCKNGYWCCQDHEKERRSAMQMSAAMTHSGHNFRDATSTPGSFLPRWQRRVGVRADRAHISCSG